MDSKVRNNSEIERRKRVRDVSTGDFACEGCIMLNELNGGMISPKNETGNDGLVGISEQDI